MSRTLRNGLLVLALASAAALAFPRPVPAELPPTPTADAFKDAKGYAIHIACEKVDPNAYDGEVSALPAAVRDRDAMAKLSKALGYEQLAVMRADTDVAGAKSTRENVLKAIKSAAEKASGATRDIVLITYAGHGGQVPDDADDSDEVDGMDETWCLYDGMLIDDEILWAVSQFQKRVRVVFVLDSCHSETAARGFQLTAKNYRDFSAEKVKKPDAKTLDIIAANAGLKGKLAYADEKGVGEAKKVAVRALKRDVALATYAKFEREYKERATKYNDKEVVKDPRKLQASMITLAACRDHQTSLDLGIQGLYTRELLRLWKDGQFDKDYNEFQRLVKEAVSTKAQDSEFNDRDGTSHQQEPQLTADGTAPSFATQKLFRIK